MKQSWEIKQLGEVCEIVKDRPKEYQGLRNYFSTGSINNSGIYDAPEKVEYSKRPSRADSYPQLNDIGFAKMKLTNKVFIVNDDLAGSIFSTGFCFLKPKQNLLTKYLYHYVISDLFQDLKNSYSGDGIMGGIKNSDVLEIQIPIPSKKEQERIVNVLDTVFDNIYKAKSNAEQNFKNAKELFESYLQRVFENGNENWETKCLDELGTITSSKRIYKSEYVKDGVPFYRTKEIKELSNGKNITLELFISRERYNEIKKSFGVPKINDLLMSAVGTIGEIMVIENNDEFYFKDGNIVWFKGFKSLDTNYLKFALTAFVEKIKSLAIGAAYSALTIEKLNKYQISFPKTIEEQQTIVQKLDALSAETKKLEAIYQQKINDLDELKKSILQKAFNGELAEPKTANNN